jgi:NAD(P)-dependent dehydrogenase (short-subunit alcohol dehydrogenase family)
MLAPKKFADTTLEEWKKIYDINVFSGIALVRGS